MHAFTGPVPASACYRQVCMAPLHLRQVRTPAWHRQVSCSLLSPAVQCKGICEAHIQAQLLRADSAPGLNCALMHSLLCKHRDAVRCRQIVRQYLGY